MLPMRISSCNEYLFSQKDCLFDTKTHTKTPKICKVSVLRFLSIHDDIKLLS